MKDSIELYRKLQLWCRMVTNKALVDGDIQRPQKCSKCSETGVIEAHHEDYRQPLVIEWLCKKCHGKADSALRRLFKTDCENAVDAVAKKRQPSVFDTRYTELLQELQSWKQGQEPLILKDTRFSELSTLPVIPNPYFPRKGSNQQRSEIVSQPWVGRRAEYLRRKA